MTFNGPPNQPPPLLSRLERLEQTCEAGWDLVALGFVLLLLVATSPLWLPLLAIGSLTRLLPAAWRAELGMPE